jgi:hypothetical protein
VLHLVRLRQSFNRHGLLLLRFTSPWVRGCQPARGRQQFHRSISRLDRIQ